jgi:hypothetical protein
MDLKVDLETFSVYGKLLQTRITSQASLRLVESTGPRSSLTLRDFGPEFLIGEPVGAAGTGCC